MDDDWRELNMPEWFGGGTLNSELLISNGSHWINQWNRVQRYYGRSEKLRRKSKCYELTDFDQDDLLSFFMYAFYLRDWIAYSHEKIKGKLDELFKNFEMGCCRNIANGFKHKKLSRPSIDADFNWYREYDYFETKSSPIKYCLAFEGPATGEIKKYEIFVLIHKAYIFWKEFINKNLI